MRIIENFLTASGSNPVGTTAMGLAPNGKTTSSESSSESSASLTTARAEARGAAGAILAASAYETRRRCATIVGRQHDLCRSVPQIVTAELRCWREAADSDRIGNPFEFTLNFKKFLLYREQPRAIMWRQICSGN